MKDEVDNGKFMDALEFNSKYSSTWLRNVDRIDVPFLWAWPMKMPGPTQKQRKSIKAHWNIAVRSSAPKKKGAKSSRASAFARQPEPSHRRNSSAGSNFIEAYQSLKQIGASKDLSPGEVVERVQLTAQIAEQRNEPNKARDALLELAKHWQGESGAVVALTSSARADLHEDE